MRRADVMATCPSDSTKSRPAALSTFSQYVKQSHSKLKNHSMSMNFFVLFFLF